MLHPAYACIRHMHACIQWQNHSPHPASVASTSTLQQHVADSMYQKSIPLPWVHGVTWSCFTRSTIIQHNRHGPLLLHKMNTVIKNQLWKQSKYVLPQVSRSLCTPCGCVGMFVICIPNPSPIAVPFFEDTCLCTEPAAVSRRSAGGRILFET